MDRHQHEPPVRVVIDIGPELRRLFFRLIDAVHDADDGAAARALSQQVRADTKKLSDAVDSSQR